MAGTSPAMTTSSASFHTSAERAHDDGGSLRLAGMTRTRLFSVPDPSRPLPHILLVDHADVGCDHVPAVGKLDPGLHLPADLAGHGGAVKQRGRDREPAAVGGNH